MKTTPISDISDTNDKKLLELAAKAAGYWNINETCGPWVGDSWDPLTDDGDALRLAVKLSLLDDPRFRHERDVLMFTKNMPKLEAHRRAFVVTAAEIGRAMP